MSVNPVTFVAPHLAWGEAPGASARGTRSIPRQWGCDRRATKPQAKWGATLRAAVLCGPGGVARSLQIHWRDMLGARAEAPRALPGPQTPRRKRHRIYAHDHLQRSRSGVVRFAIGFMLALVPVLAESEFASRQTGNANALFTNDSVLRIRIELRPQNVQALREESRRYVRATLYAEGKVYRDVGVHLKGSTGSFRGIDDKPGLTLDFGRFAPDQKFHDLRKIHLNNSVEDPSYVNELIGSELFRAAGVPAPRVSHALVEMNGRPLGLYVLKEGFTEDFLSIYFKRVDGNLYDTDWGHDVGERMKRLSGRDPENEQRDLEALAAATREPDLGRRWQRLEHTLELDRFVTFMALEVMICHRDGYCMARNNFRIYDDPETGRMVFLPHGMDQLFGKADLPWKPHMAGLVARSALETPEGRQRYEAQFRSIFTNLFIVDRLTNRVN
ncbi:MAG: hypothetical protein E6L09_13700, partial [Verrucomicrobia bacterium]